ncbi:helix-turn-helix transcriptional regulator [Thalassomonas viridans]|uniref:Helix-turn-helix transcriptional regulator n=1 Tax=Thalassomonas viridans TaxID=137584 RepID=A0AAE9Z130_9GAMM|nr:helix-turn-helix transcriptional regulator [Thalassomonas viridans]WDE04100.1 helix-turn-helix transcriptional regulator [Thalassomonas viridans]
MLNLLVTGADLKRMRLSRNYTTEEMAEMLGVSRITYERYESGQSRISWNAGLNLTIWCGYDISVFLKQMESLKQEFSQYKDQKDETKPNTQRASSKKNHLRQAGIIEPNKG